MEVASVNPEHSWERPGDDEKIQRYLKRAWQREEITTSYFNQLELLENKLCSFLQVKCLCVMQERQSLHTKKSLTRFQISFIYFRTSRRECRPWYEVERFSKRMGNSVQQQCGGSSAYGMRTLLYCNNIINNDIILMLLDFLIWFSLLKNLEGKIQNCLEMMVGDNRLGTFLRVISSCTLIN